jgi:methanogenic corrinoid protein MtbC1
MTFSVPTVIDDIVVPLLTRIGTSWEAGRTGPAHEHLGTVTIRRFLEWMMGNVEVGGGAPVMIAATPAGERHELGALLSALSGAAEGWKSVFLGPDLPAGEIVTAALRLEAEVVALSCVDPRLKGTFADEVLKVRGRLPADVHLVVGGALTRTSPQLAETDGVEILESFEDLRETLRDYAQQT